MSSVSSASASVHSGVGGASKISTSLALKCLWICALSFQYGYNISALNGLHDVMQCAGDGQNNKDGHALIPPCYDMTTLQYGLLSSIYTVGGFLGSLSAGSIADSKGRKRACIVAALCVGLGAAVMVCSPTYAFLVAGRSVVGIGCGLATVIVPTFLNEIAPLDKKGSIGTLNQLGIVTGIFAGQSASLALARPHIWRYVLGISACIAALQVLLSGRMVESPEWLENSKARSSTSSIDEQDEQQRLLGQAAGPLYDNEGSSRSTGEAPSTMSGVIKSPLTRRGLTIVVLTQITQQASGINAVLYFSTDIMKKALPAKAGAIALLITAVNLVMTFPPMYLIDHLGRKPLLLASTTFMALSSFLLALTIGRSPVLSSIAILSFVSSFSIGLGPIPFILIPEVVPPRSAAALGSLGLGLNWIVNGCVGIAFLPLLEALGGRGVFLFFAVVLAVATCLVAATLK